MGHRSLMALAVALVALSAATSAEAQQRQTTQPSPYAVLERTVKDLLAVTVVPPRTEVVADTTVQGTVTRVTGSLKLAPTYAGRTWGMTAIVAF